MNRFQLAIALLGFVATVGIASPVAGQAVPGVHYRYAAQTPPGLVGRERLQQGGPVVGYMQPVSLSAPKGMTIEIARDGEFVEATEGVLLVGMPLGPPYRVRLSNIPLHEGEAVYPTIELVDRTYPPPGLELKFPIPIVFNEDDVKLALQGMFITRVVYVEDPSLAIPGGQQPGEQLWHDAGPNVDALAVADALGRPVAIVRLGGRTPDMARGPDRQFFFGSPSWRYFATLPPASETKSVLPSPLPVKSARRPLPTEVR